jgi:hypothetical protein
MKKIVRTALAAAALASATLAQAQEVTLKFHHIWNTQAMASVNVIAPGATRSPRNRPTSSSARSSRP